MSAEQDHGHPPATSTVDADKCCVAPSIATPFAGPSTGVGVVTYRVEELDCATEENDLRAVLTPLPGVRSLEFDLVGRRVRVRHELASPEPIEAAIRELGMRPSVVVEAEGAELSRSLSRRSIVVTGAGAETRGLLHAMLPSLRKSLAAQGLCLSSLVSGQGEEAARGERSVGERELDTYA